ncbi:uncharacterized protein LOC135196216 isoform X3 [Macrobrachium nipponense]|uniref:uncharacterized protein LOC135196216 isoform X3 n=1 Tax=Macrobrachium nipponense TaxID=159736 RepID=UPI0030C885F8
MNSRRPLAAGTPLMYPPLYLTMLPDRSLSVVAPITYHPPVRMFQIPQNYQNPCHFTPLPPPTTNYSPCSTSTLTWQGSVPLLPTPPPLMPLPHRPCFLPNHTSYNGCFRRQKNRTSTSTQTSSTQDKSVSVSLENEIPLMTDDESPSHQVLPLMPSISSSVNSKIVNLKFLGDLESLKRDIGEMLIRGSVYDYDQNSGKGFLKSGTSLKIEVSKDVIYTEGRQAGGEETLSDVSALGTNIKAFIEKIPMTAKKGGAQELQEIIKNDESVITHRAVLAWFGEVPDVEGLLPFIEQSESVNQDIFDEVDAINDRNRTKDQCKSIPPNDILPLSHFIGYIWWANKDNGILRIYQEKAWGSEFSGILFTCDVVHFEGQKVSCEMLHFLVAHLNRCDVKARKIDCKQIHGMTILWEAVHVEFGPFPLSFIRKENHEDRNYGRCATGVLFDSSKVGVYSDIQLDNNCEDVDQDASQKHMQNITPFSVSENNEKNEIEKYWDKSLKNRALYMMNELRISCDKKDSNNLKISKLFLRSIPNEYSGKHLTGHIIKLFSQQSNIGIAQWKSMEYGIVNILFKQSDLYVDLVPINKTMELSSLLCNRRCNLYVLPFKEQNCLGFKVKLAATCGWIGTKPLSIPTPGEQTKAQISLSHLKDEQLVNASVAELSTITVTTSSSSISKTNDEQLRKEKAAVLTMDDKSTCKGNRENGKKYNAGRVIEIYCNMGKLESEDGVTYYFSRDQCYLFGINLCHVELWHVLVHGVEACHSGENVFFTLIMNARNQAKIDEVMIGSETPILRKACQIEHVAEWCKNNSVPDSAKDILTDLCHLELPVQ